MSARKVPQPSRHFTMRAAERRADKLNRERPASGRSSGWGRVDYVVRRRRGLRRWQVETRSL